LEYRPDPGKEGERVADFIEQPWLTKDDLEKWEARRRVIYDLVKETARHGQRQPEQWREGINQALRVAFGRQGGAFRWYVAPKRPNEVVALPHPIGEDGGKWRYYPSHIISEWHGFKPIPAFTKYTAPGPLRSRDAPTRERLCQRRKAPALLQHRLPITWAEWLNLVNGNDYPNNLQEGDIFFPFREISDRRPPEIKARRKDKPEQSRELLHFPPEELPPAPAYKRNIYQRHPRRDGILVYCPLCEKGYMVTDAQDLKCSLCGSNIVVVESVNLTIGYHKLTQTSDTTYKTEICFVGNAPHTQTHKERLDRDRLSIRRRLTRGSVGSWRCKVNQAVDVVEPLNNPLTGVPYREGGQVVAEEYDLKCDECGALVRYNQRYEKECSGCGLLASNSAYRAMENYFNMVTREEPEAQGDSDWKLRELNGGSEREINEYIHYWRAARRGDKPRVNKQQITIWENGQREAFSYARNKRRFDPKHKNDYIKHNSRKHKTKFLDDRICLILSNNGNGGMEQKEIHRQLTLFPGESTSYSSIKKAVNRMEKAGRIKAWSIYDNRGKIKMVRLVAKI
jgi:hypothetical protein